MCAHIHVYMYLQIHTHKYQHEIPLLPCLWPLLPRSSYSLCSSSSPTEISSNGSLCQPLIIYLGCTSASPDKISNILVSKLHPNQLNPNSWRQDRGNWYLQSSPRDSDVQPRLRTALKNTTKWRTTALTGNSLNSFVTPPRRECILTGNKALS